MAAEEPSVGVVGRESELGSIDRFIQAVRGGPAALLIEGEPGIGKTALWTEGVAAARRASYTVLSSRPTSAEAKLPYLGLADLFAPIPEGLLHQLPVPQRRALEVALLREEEDKRPLQQRSVSAAVLNALVLQSRSGPLLIAIDDVQWLDPPSRRVLQFAVRRIGTAPIGILVAFRSDGSGEDPLGLGLAFPHDRFYRVHVGPLDPSALDRVLRSRLHAAFSGPTLRQLERASEGNPFYALELGRVLLAVPEPLVLGRPLPVPSSLTQLLGARLARLPGATREALLVASAASRPTIELVRAAAPDGERVDALDRAADAGIIEMHDASVRFTHPLLASVMYSQASESQRRRVHERLAEVVGDPEERATHLALAALHPDEAIASTIEKAARRAARRGAPDAAAGLLEQAMRLTPPRATGSAARRTLEAADQHIAAGETARARSLLEDVVASSGAGTARARALHRLSRVRVLEEGYGPARSLLEQALAEVGGDRALRASIERDIVLALTQVGSLSEALPHAYAGLEAAETAGQLALVAGALGYLCMARFLIGEGVDRELLDRAMALDERVGPAPLPEHPGIITGRLALAVTLKWADRFEEARALLRSLRRDHLENGDEGSLAPVLFQLGELECWAGDWQAGTALAVEAHEVASRTGQTTAERLALTLEASVQAHRGEVEPARANAEASLARSEHAEDPRFVIRNLKVLGFLELSLGDPTAAHHHLERAIELEAGPGYDPGVLRLLPDEVEALVSLGELQLARPLVERLEAKGKQLDRPWALATGARCRGLVEGASGEPDRALEALERAMVEHERLPQPFERGRTMLALGMAQRRARRRGPARETLGQALEIFEELGARLWAAKTRAELERIGGRVASRFELSETERRVAELVATGQTNREVAASLFLSAKTVETNLTHIYRKLGVSSRRQLARQIRPISSSEGTDQEERDSP